MNIKRDRDANFLNSPLRPGLIALCVLVIAACSDGGAGAPRPPVVAPQPQPPLVTSIVPFVVSRPFRPEEIFSPYDLDDVGITIDGLPAAFADLRAGDIAVIRGTRLYRNDQLDSRGIDTIDVHHLVIGPVDSIDIDHARLAVMGQQVSVTGDTFVDDESVSNGGLAAIQPGDTVAVGGFLTASGEMVATRISRRASQGAVLLRGLVAAADPAANRFRIGGLDVTYGQADIDLQDFPSGAPRAGDKVMLRSKAAPVDATLDADSVAFVPRTLGVAEDAEVELTGAISFTSGADLDVDGVPVNLDCTDIHCGDPPLLHANALVEVNGTYDAVRGNVRARRLGRTSGGPIELTAPIDAIEPGTRSLTALGFQVQSFASTQVSDEPDGRTSPLSVEDLQVGDIVAAQGTYGGVPGLLIASSIRRVPAQDPRMWTWSFQRAEPALIVLGRSILTNGSTMVERCETPIDVRRLFSETEWIDALVIELQASPADSLAATRVSIYNHGC
jgi:hypothetical protein